MSVTPSPFGSKATYFGVGVALVLVLWCASSIFLQKVPSRSPQEQQQNNTQTSVPLSSGAPQNQIQNAPQLFSQENIRKLVEPIALYPDALVALILPASTVPSDVVLASRYLQTNGDPQQIASQPWDDSVQSLANDPQIITWMDQNLEWTTSLGQAFMTQQSDVMNAIQQLRAQAQALGNLVSTPQQTILVQNDIARIVPADPAYIYIPVYDPQIVYEQPPPQNSTLVTFTTFLVAGPWLNYDFDWNRRVLCRGTWQKGWGTGGINQGPNGSANVNNIHSNTAQVWQPSQSSLQRLVWKQRNVVSPQSVPLSSGQLASDVPFSTRQRIPVSTDANGSTHFPPNRTLAVQLTPSFVPTSQSVGMTASALHPGRPPGITGQSPSSDAHYYIQKTQIPVVTAGQHLQPATQFDSPSGKTTEQYRAPNSPARNISADSAAPADVSSVVHPSSGSPNSITSTTHLQNQRPPSDYTREAQKLPQAPVVKEATEQNQSHQKNLDPNKKDNP